MGIVLGLFIVIAIHECGHLIIARILKVEVQKVYIFFNPYFTVLKIKIKKTEFGLGWVPMGGYVNFKDNEVAVLKRIAIYSGGVLFNFILGFSLIGLKAFSMFWDYGNCILSGKVIAISNYNYFELVGFLSLLVGVINMIPFGVFDGKKIWENLKQFRNLRFIAKQYKKHLNKKSDGKNI